MTPEPVDLGGESDRDLVKFAHPVEKSRKERCEVDFSGSSTVTCPCCGANFVPKLRMEGRFGQALSDFVLKRSHRGADPIRSGDEGQCPLSSEPE